MSIALAIRSLEEDLRGVFGPRLQSLVAYGTKGVNADGHAPARTMALVESLTEHDLRACATRVSAWHTAGLATPLMVPAAEFGRALDAFPLEFGAIIADHEVIAGTPPFSGMRVDAADIRRACEVQARSHLLHLREGFLETAGNGHALAVLIMQSAAPLAGLLQSVARLEGRTDPDAEAAARHAERQLGVTEGLAAVAAFARGHDLAAADAERLFPTYLAAVEKLVDYVDGWAAK
jgi:hypothetical protein